MDCDFNTSKLLSFDEALDRLVSQATPVTEIENVSVFEIKGRILAEDVASSVNLPPYDNSAMDGYAVNHDGADISASFPVIDTSLAGHPATKSLNQGEAIRIMTGAKIPQGTTAIVMQENVARENDSIILNSAPKSNDNIRFTGEDIKAGQVILSSGHLLSSRDSALLSACGLDTVPVYRRIKVGLFSTGDELTEPGTHLQPGQLYDSNRPMLYSMLSELDVAVKDFGILPDEPDAIRHALTQAEKTMDIIITSGGVSVGDADYIKQILDELGQVNFWKVAMKPGKPIAFGYLSNCAFIGLPGNPVSSAVTFGQLATPFIRQTQRHPQPIPDRLNAIATDNFKKRPGRLDFQRGIAEFDDGKWSVKNAGKQGSAMLSALSKANCHVLLLAESDGATAGEVVSVILYD